MPTPVQNADAAQANVPANQTGKKLSPQKNHDGHTGSFGRSRPLI